VVYLNRQHANIADRPVAVYDRHTLYDATKKSPTETMGIKVPVVGDES